MIDTVEEVAQLAVNSQEDGAFSINLESIEADLYPNVLDKTLLVDMLSNRPEFKEIECKNGDLIGSISDDYIAGEICDEESGISM